MLPQPMLDAVSKRGMRERGQGARRVVANRECWQVEGLYAELLTRC